MSVMRWLPGEVAEGAFKAWDTQRSGMVGTERMERGRQQCWEGVGWFI